VTSDPGQHASATYLPNHLRYLIGPTLRQQVVHDSTVDVASICPIGSSSFDAHLVGSDLRTGLRKPLNAPTLIPVFQQQANDVKIGTPNDGIDAQRFGCPDSIFDPGSSIVPHHCQVLFCTLVRKATERIATQDEAADLNPTYLDVFHRFSLAPSLKFLLSLPQYSTGGTTSASIFFVMRKHEQSSQIRDEGKLA
jgi:hypothetical protein